MSQNESSFYKVFTMASVVILVIFVIIFIAVQDLVGTDTSVDTKDPVALKAVEERIQPVGQVQIAGKEVAEDAAPVVAAAPADPASLWTANCSACHATGALNAPKKGDKAAWAPRIAQGIDVLKANAISGLKMMPPKGGSSLDDATLGSVVEYMVNESK